MELRDKVCDIVFRAVMCDGNEFDAMDAAKAILAIPEIAEALELYEQWLDSPDSPPLSTPEEVRAYFAKIRPNA